MNRHKWIFIEATHDEGCTRLHYICGNIGCNEASYFETGSRYISNVFWSCFKELNRYEGGWDRCKGITDGE